MRELKFRAWDKRNNCWEDFNDLKINKNGIVFDKDYDWEEEVWYYKPDEEHNFVVEQYTGLKDKNGKEIYEGDIVKVIGYGLYEVFWRKWDSSFILRPIDESVVAENKVLMLCEDWEEDYEVIGNIHENKELLNGYRED